jgi:hypothetical protein
MISSIQQGKRYFIPNADITIKVGHGDALCIAICETIGRPKNYRFYAHRAHLLGDQTRDFPRTLQNCQYREFRCSQRTPRTPSKIPDPTRQRNRASMQTFNCGGIIKLVFLSSIEDRLGKTLHPHCPLFPGAIIVQYEHSIEHEGRQNVALPEAIRTWIMESFHKSPAETFRALRHLMTQGRFPDVPLHLVTPYNTTYWWTVALETRMGTRGDPWVNVVDYLQRNPHVSIPFSGLIKQAEVVPFCPEPRKHVIWFVHQRFGVDLENVTEIFVDATFGTNSVGAHLYSILAQESAWCVPLAYMLLEAKPKEQTNDSNPDVTAATRNLFAAAQSRGLNPIFVHVDKCFSEILAAKVNMYSEIC